MDPVTCCTTEKIDNITPSGSVLVVGDLLLKNLIMKILNAGRKKIDIRDRWQYMSAKNIFVLDSIRVSNMNILQVDMQRSKK